MLKPCRDYEEACRTFRWRIPDRYNLAFDLCDRHSVSGADGHRTALVVDDGNGRVDRYSFTMLRLLTNRVCTVLDELGVGPGDRVVVSLPPSVETAALLLAAPRMGAVIMPLPMGLPLADLIGLINHADARVAVVSPADYEGLMDHRHDLHTLNAVLTSLGNGDEADLWSLLERASDKFDLALTGANDAALLFHPWGESSGVLHAHRAVLGNLPAMEFALGFFAQPGDVLWTSWDWMSFEGLMWAVLPAWHHGVPVIASPHPFDPERGLRLMADHGVRTLVAPPDQLSALTAAALTNSHTLPRAIASGPDPLPRALHEAVQRAFDVVASEIWGTCRIGAVAANNAAIMELRVGSPGKIAPGIVVDTVSFDGQRRLGAGHNGILAASPQTPGACLGLWGQGPAAVQVAQGWIHSGWSGSRDLDGYVWPDPRPGLEIRVPDIAPAAADDGDAIPLRLDGVTRDERW